MPMMPYAESSIAHPPDAALLAAALGGDERAFTTLYRRHSSTIYRFAYLWSGTAEIAAEMGLTPRVVRRYLSST